MSLHLGYSLIYAVHTLRLMTKFYDHLSFPHKCYMPYAPYSLWFNSPQTMWWWVQASYKKNRDISTPEGKDNTLPQNIWIQHPLMQCHIPQEWNPQQKVLVTAPCMERNWVYTTLKILWCGKIQITNLQRQELDGCDVCSICSCHRQLYRKT
jgi:hypothetical protein